MNFANLFTPNLSITSVVIDGVTGTNPTGGAVEIGQALSYQLNASTVLNGKRESITGGFDFDPLTDIEWGALIQFTGPAPFAGLWPFDAEQLPVGDLVDLDLNGWDLIQIKFANDLSYGTDPLASVRFGLDAFDTSPTGFAVGPPAPTVPEPTTLSVLGAALGLLLLSPWAIRRRATTPGMHVMPEYRAEPRGARSILRIFRYHVVARKEGSLPSLIRPQTLARLEGLIDNCVTPKLTHYLPRLCGNFKSAPS